MFGAAILVLDVFDVHSVPITLCTEKGGKPYHREVKVETHERKLGQMGGKERDKVGGERRV